MISNTDTVRRYNGPFTLNQEIYYDIAFIEEADLVLTIDSDTTLSIDSDYRVDPVRSEGLIIGADITLLKAYPDATTLVVSRVTSATQEQDYPENGPFESTDIERGLDKLTMIAQEHGYMAYNRCIRINGTEVSGFDTELPPAGLTPGIVVIKKNAVDIVDIDPQSLLDAVADAEAAADRAETAADRAEAAADRAEAAADAAEAYLAQIQSLITEYFGGLKFRALSKTEYEGIASKDEGTVYIIDNSDYEVS